jgi:hypothetical protein
MHLQHDSGVRGAQLSVRVSIGALAGMVLPTRYKNYPDRRLAIHPDTGQQAVSTVITCRQGKFEPVAAIWDWLNTLPALSTLSVGFVKMLVAALLCGAILGTWYVLLCLNWRRREPHTLAVTRDGFDAGNRQCGAD